MIKMIAGIYGHRVNGAVVAKTPKSEPFELDPKEEERLVEAGVAEYVEETKKAPTTVNAKKTESKAKAEKAKAEAEKAKAEEPAPTFGAESTVVE